MKKENTKLSIVILLIVVISLSVTYAFMTLNATSGNNSGEGGCFNVNYSGEEINNTSLQSTTDYTLGAKSNVVLSKSTDCKIYSEAEIYIHTDATLTDAPLSNGALKYKVMQGSTEISTGSIAAVTADTEEDQLLATVPLSETETTYTIYLWIDPSISQGTYHEKNYSGYIYASSVQTSTVTE